MTENIRSIFEHDIKLLGDMDKAVYYFREQQYTTALNMLASSIDQIKFVIEAIITDRDYFNLVDTESMLEMLTGILEAKKNKDFILLADFLELQLISFIIRVQELIISKEEIIFNEENYKENIQLLLQNGVGFPEELNKPINTAKLLEDGYRVEFTSSGRMTLAAENEGAKFYFHTNSRIKAEAFLLARHWYQKDVKKYVIYGFGMGYHIDELQAMATGAEIEVYEADHHVIQLACAFTQVKELLINKRIKLSYDPTFEILKNKIASLGADEVFLVHYPSFRNVRSIEGKEILETSLPWSKTIEDC